MASTDSSLTPEQKLLKIIEQGGESATPKNSSGAGGSESASSGKKQGVSVSSFLSPSAIKGRLQYARDWIQAYSKGKKDPIDFRKINQGAKLVVACFAIYLSLAIVYEVFNVNRSYDSNMKISPKEMAEPPEVETRKIDPSLFDEVDKRNVFIPQEKRLATTGTAEPVSNPIRLVELIKDLKLTGISINPADDSKTYCMVEDIKKNITNFLRVGNMISGLKVAQINSEGIVLKNQNDSIELR